MDMKNLWSFLLGISAYEEPGDGEYHAVQNKFTNVMIEIMNKCAIITFLLTAVH